jgi:enamine deaminase RidA (YjgF/YER057c/UK114 family)
MSSKIAQATAEERMSALGIVLPTPPIPLGAYVEAVQTGNLLFLSGTLPVESGIPRFQGRLGGDLGVEGGRQAARLAALNALAAAREHLGSLNKVSRVVRLAVSLVTTPDFTQHAKVADAASELLGSVFGTDRMSTRMVYGPNTLPAGVSVVVELILEVRSTAAL